MALTSLQVCMDSSDWFQGSVNEESGGMESSSPSGDMLTCSRPLLERKLRPPHDQALKCPRCDSTHTKFCYYNNYSLSQPRYFCKTCRRYWTKGGTLRNIPVGGGCRKNKRVSKKSANDQQHHLIGPSSGSSSTYPTDLHLSFPDQVHYNHITNLLGTHMGLGNGFNSGMLENHNPRAIDFMECNMNYDHQFGGNGDMGFVGYGELNNGLAQNFNGFTPFVTPLDDNNGSLIDTCQGLMLPYEGNSIDHHVNEVKPNAKLLSIDWQDQGCLNGLGSWTGMMNGYGSSATNPLV